MGLEGGITEYKTFSNIIAWESGDYLEFKKLEMNVSSYFCGMYWTLGYAKINIATWQKQNKNYYAEQYWKLRDLRYLTALLLTSCIYYS